MSIHLDANFLIALQTPGSAEDRLHRSWLASGQSIQTSAIAWSEFLCGPPGHLLAESAQFMVGTPLAFTAADAERAADLFNLGGRRRGSLADCQIAAVAIRAGAALATLDRPDFARFTPAGLVLAVPV